MCLFDLLNPPMCPTCSPAPDTAVGSFPRTARVISDVEAIDAIYHQLICDYGDWGADTLAAITEILTRAGLMVVDVEAIEAEMIEDQHGWPIARVNADQVIGYVRQELDGGILYELFTRDADAADRLRVQVDGQPLWGVPLPGPPAQATRPPAHSSAHQPDRPRPQ